MFGNIKQFLSKLRIFKRLRDYKAREYRLIYQLKQLQNIIAKNNTFMFKQVEQIEALEKDLDVSREKHKKASKHYGELINRRDEVINRLQLPAPDDIISGRFSDYKLWIAEPFIKEVYTKYRVESDLGMGNVFIDGSAAIRGLDNIFDIIDKDNIIDEEKDVKKEEESEE